MKKTGMFLWFVLLVYMFTVSAAYASSDGVSICINARPLLTSHEAYIENSRAMVPARSIFESLGAQVEWNGEDRTVTASNGDTKVKLIIGSRSLNVNGKLSMMDTEPVIIDGTTFVPTRAVAQAFSANVMWIDTLRTVNITTGNTKTFADHPTVLIPDLSDVDAVCISEKSDSVMYAVTVPEEENEFVAPRIIELVRSYEDAMTNAGWGKDIQKDSSVLFETDFSEDPLNVCPCSVKFFVTKTGVGNYTICVNILEHITVYNVLTGEIEKMTESDYLMTAKYRDTSVWKRSVGKKITLYDNNNNTVDVYDYEAYGYLTGGYTEKQKTVVMYSPEGKTEYIAVHLISEYRAQGYNTRETILMYSADGRKEHIQNALVEQRISEGWSTEPFKITLYNHNGDIILADLHEKDNYLAVGWYEEPVIPMYHNNGTKIFVKKSDMELYIALGWSTAMPEKEEVSEKDKMTEYTTVYTTPNGKKYHISQKCAGSGAIQRAYREVQGMYEPCKNCTDN